jgi:hypothetical protein
MRHDSLWFTIRFKARPLASFDSYGIDPKDIAEHIHPDFTRSGVVVHDHTEPHVVRRQGFLDIHLEVLAEPSWELIAEGERTMVSAIDDCFSVMIPGHDVEEVEVTLSPGEDVNRFNHWNR